MLQDIRDHTQGVVAKIIIGLIVAVFALWGVQSIIGGFITSPAVAEVNGDEISEQQLANNTQTLLNSLGGNAESFDQALVEQVALNQLVEEKLLQQSAAGNSMRVSDNRIDQEILQTAEFQIDGVFNSDLALRTMRSQGYSVPYYRELLRNNMLLAQIANAYTGSNFVTEAELVQIAKLRLQSRDFRFVSVPIGTRTLGEAISDEEIANYYAAHTQDFAIEESVKVSYVLLDKNLLAESMPVDEALISAQYERERGAFEASTERRASHILFEVGPALSQDEALTRAAAAKARLDAGEDFGALARELSSDTISAEDDGDIGFSDGSAFPEAVEEALNSLELGEVSAPVVSEFGVHLVKLTEDNESQYPPLEEVSERIARELKTADAESLFAEQLETLSNLAFETPDLQTISTQLNLPIQESESIPRSGGLGVFSSAAVIAAAFSDDVINGGHNSDLVEVNDNQALVLRLLEHAPASVQPMEEVQGEIAVILRTDMERARAAALGQEILAALENGEPVDELLSSNELEWQDAAGTVRNQNTINPQVVNSVFAMQQPESAENPEFQGLELANGTYVVIQLNSVNPGNLDDLAAEERSSIIDSLTEEMAQAEFAAYMASLRAQADITTRLPAQDSF